MDSKSCRGVLVYEYKNQDLTPEDFENTLMYFAELYHKEKTENKCNSVKDSNIVKTYMFIENKNGLTDVWSEGICLGNGLDTNGINKLCL